MEAVAGYVLQALGVLLLVGLAVNLVVLLLVSREGLFVLVAIVGFALPTAVGAGAALAAVDFLYPSAVTVDGFADFFWLIVLASLMSTAVFDLGAEGALLRLLQRLGLDMDSIRLVEAVAGSLFVAAALSAATLLLPSVAVSAGAALVAGLVSAFARYFLGLYLDDKIVGEAQDLEEEGSQQPPARQEAPPRGDTRG